MTATAQQVAQMVDILPDSDQTLALELVKKLVLAWDPDFTKVTPQEAARLEKAVREMEAGEYVLESEIHWK